MTNESNSPPNDSHFRERKEQYTKERVLQELGELDLREASAYSFGFLLPFWLLICSAPAVWYLVRMVIEGMFEKNLIDWTLFIGGAAAVVFINALFFVVIVKNLKELARIRAERRALKVQLLPSASVHRTYL